MNWLNLKERPIDTSFSSLTITVKGLHFYFGDKHILNNLNFRIQPGELVGLIGPNGCGKSTLINLISNILKPSSGTISLGKYQLDQLSFQMAAKIRSVVLQDNRVNFDFSVKDIIEMGRYPWRDLKEPHTKQLIENIVKQTEITHLLAHEYRSLSGGEQQRVNFAKALIQDTPIMLLDEPTSAMDINHQENLMQQLSQQKKQQKTIVTVLHDLSLAAAYCDRVILLEQGKIIVQGKPQQVLQEEILSEVYQYPIQVLTDPQTNELLIKPCRNLN